MLLKILRVWKFIICLSLSSTLIMSCNSFSSNQSNEEAFIQAVNEVETTEYKIDSLSSVLTWIYGQDKNQHTGLVPITSGSLHLVEKQIVSGSITIGFKDIITMDLVKDSTKHTVFVNEILSDIFSENDSTQNIKIKIISVSQIQEIDSTDLNMIYPYISDFILKQPTHIISAEINIKDSIYQKDFPAIISFSHSAISIEGRMIFELDLKIKKTEPVSNTQKSDSLQQETKSKISIGMFLKAEIKL
jgi:hypothetical protein